MKSLIFTAFLSGLLLSFPCHSLAQGDIRSATGLPIPIGAPAIWGEVKISGLAPNEKKPLVFVTLLVSGSQVDRVQANDKGIYYFLRAAINGSTLVFEVNNNEIGRVVLSGGLGNDVRRDIEVNMGALASAPPGVISAKNLYGRSAENDALFEKAMASVKAKKPDEATTQFKALVEKDPKDFIAWTELGTLYFGAKKYTDAEAAYTKALELKPDLMVALMNLGKLQLNQNQADKAIETFTKAANADKNSADAFHYLGESYLQAKQGSKAVVAMNEAIRLAPSEKAELHLRLARLYNAAGAKAQAANEYKAFLVKKPDHPDKSKLEQYIQENSKQ